jgi:hypothetical protein
MSSDHGIPLGTVLRINAARTIDLDRYEEDGHFDRFGHLRCVAEDNGVPLTGVIELAQLLGPDEDFDGLVVSVEDGADMLREAYR